MAIEFHLPKSIDWLTEQNEPGVQARDIVDTRMDALAQMVEDAKADFDASIAAMNQTVTPIAVGNMDIAVPVVGINVDPTSTKPNYTDFTWQDGDTSTLDESTVTALAEWLVNTDDVIPTSVIDALYPDVSVSLDEPLVAALSEWLVSPADVIPATLIDELYAEQSFPMSDTLSDTLTLWISSTDNPLPESLIESVFSASADDLPIEAVFTAKLESWLDSATSAIPSALLASMYEAEEIRLDARRAESAARISADIAARGFEMPGGMQAAQLAQVEAQYDIDATALSANLAAKNMELTQDHLHKTADLINGYIAAAKDATFKWNDASARMYIAAAELMQANRHKGAELMSSQIALSEDYAIKISDGRARLYGAAAELRQSAIQKAADTAMTYISTSGDFIIKKGEGMSKLYMSSAELGQQRMQRAAELANQYIAAAQDYVVKKNEAATKLYVAAIDAWVSEYKALVEGASEDAKVQTQLYQVETTAEIEKQRILVTAQNANQTFAQSVLDSQSKLQAQMVASGLSGMHVQASISSSHGTGQDVGYRYSYSEGMDENHSESQTVKTSDS